MILTTATRDLGLNVSLRIGGSRIRTRDWIRVEPDYSADILVGTYEGIDQVLRAGDAELLGESGRSWSTKCIC